MSRLQSYDHSSDSTTYACSCTMTEGQEGGHMQRCLQRLHPHCSNERREILRTDATGRLYAKQLSLASLNRVYDGALAAPSSSKQAKNLTQEGT